MVIARDLTQANAPKEIYNEVKQAGIEGDYLINNAGFGWHGKLIATFLHQRLKPRLAILRNVE